MAICANHIILLILLIIIILLMLFLLLIQLRSDIRFKGITVLKIKITYFYVNTDIEYVHFFVYE